MGKFGLPEISLPGFSEFDDVPDFNPVQLFRDSSSFSTSRQSSPFDFDLDIPSPFTESSFTNVPFESFSRFSMPEILSSGLANYMGGEGLSDGIFGDVLNFNSMVTSSPDRLLEFGLHGGAEGLQGIVGSLTSPLKLFGGFGESASGIMGAFGNFANPLSGVLGGIMGGGGGFLGSALGIAGSLVGTPLLGMGLSALANVIPFGKIFGGLKDAVGGVLGGIGKGIGKGIGAIAGGIGKLFGGLF